jgi:hypothetical protein
MGSLGALMQEFWKHDSRGATVGSSGALTRKFKNATLTSSDRLTRGRYRRARLQEVQVHKHGSSITWLWIVQYALTRRFKHLCCTYEISVQEVQMRLQGTPGIARAVQLRLCQSSGNARVTRQFRFAYTEVHKVHERISCSYERGVGSSSALLRQFKCILW